jgi:O-6-methylguanine DNA methyltransferase
MDTRPPYYLIVDCWLGHLLVAGTARGLCAVSLGEDDAALEAELSVTCPQATHRPDDPQLQAWAGALLEHLDGKRPELDLPLDVPGTAFQERVWQALRAIPYGQTHAYGEIARSLGAESSARAVARACASNQVALVIPCHRVVGQNGELTGFRWGLGRKQLLLEREQQVSGHPVQLGLSI